VVALQLCLQLIHGQLDVLHVAALFLQGTHRQYILLLMYGLHTKQQGKSQHLTAAGLASVVPSGRGASILCVLLMP
jgi:hypothetical protein